jgi:hypothetical protein
MMAHEVKTLLRSRPFQGLRFHISDGESYEVRHPDMVFVTASKVEIALPPLDAHGLATGGSVHVDPLHITRIQPLAGRRLSRNGRRRKQ